MVSQLVCQLYNGMDIGFGDYFYIYVFIFGYLVEGELFFIYVFIQYVGIGSFGIDFILLSCWFFLVIML